KAFMDEGLTIQTGGTDNHMMLLDVTGLGLNGRQAESILISCGITLNRNALPFDQNGPWYTSGLRIGTPAVTTLGMGPDEMKEIASIITDVLRHTRPAVITKGEKAGQPSRSKAVIDEDEKARALDRVHKLLSRFVLYPELDLEFLEENFKEVE
ncbi:MAG: glycine hydroxymethyltransferase, partial [Spirochaetales bacterium]|nr:glycine hydroxymethyltransferase [Spirochaetales bacterium]